MDEGAREPPSDPCRPVHDNRGKMVTSLAPSLVESPYAEDSSVPSARGLERRSGGKV